LRTWKYWTNGRRSPFNYKAAGAVLALAAFLASLLDLAHQQPPKQIMWCNLCTRNQCTSANSSSSRLGFGISGHLQPSRQFLTRQHSFSSPPLAKSIHQTQQLIEPLICEGSLRDIHVERRKAVATSLPHTARLAATRPHRL
jgi:hypothetical protein